MCSLAQTLKYGSMAPLKAARSSLLRVERISVGVRWDWMKRTSVPLTNEQNQRAGLVTAATATELRHCPHGGVGAAVKPLPIATHKELGGSRTNTHPNKPLDHEVLEPGWWAPLLGSLSKHQLGKTCNG